MREVEFSASLCLNKKDLLFLYTIKGYNAFRKYIRRGRFIMDTLKKIANRKLIAITMAVQAVVLFISAIVSYSSMSYYFRGVSIALLMLIIIAVGLAIVSYCMISKRNDVVLLVGVSIITFGYMVRFLTNIRLITFIYMLPWLAVCLLAVMITMPDKIPQLEKIKKYAMILGLVAAGIFLFVELSDFVTPFIYGYGFPIATLIVVFIRNVFTFVLTAVSFSLFAIYMGVTAQGEEQSDIDADFSKVSDTISKAANDITSGPITMSLATHVLLLLLTCGIWLYIWIYKVTGYLNREAEEKRTPVNQLLLCMFVPFYYIYWVYKSAEIIDSMYKSRNQKSDITTMCLILAIFINIVPPIIMQEKINNLENMDTMENHSNTTQNTENHSTYAAGNATDELREYKKLLDEGVITEEEFETKKKQIMGL